MVGADEISGKERRGMNWEIEMEKKVKTGMHFLEKHVGCIGRIALAVYVMKDRDQKATLEFLGGGSGGQGRKLPTLTFQTPALPRTTVTLRSPSMLLPIR